MPDHSKPTSRDVAELAGVSQTTVSYVMSGRRPVSSNLRERVLAAMDQLGYHPDASARALKARRPRVIGAVVPYRTGADPAAQHYLITSIVRAARRFDHDVLVLTTDEGVSGIRRVVETGLCAGLLVMEVIDDDPRAAVAETLSTPSVFIGLPGGAATVTAVDGDYEQAGRQAATELADRGHQNLHLVEPADPSVTSLGFLHRFREGVLGAARSLGVAVDLTPCEVGLPGARTCIGPMLDSALHEGPPGIILGPMINADDWSNALIEAGEQPGRTASLIAASWDPVHPHTTVLPTHFDMRPERLAKTAVRLLVDLIENGRPAVQETVLIPPRLADGDTLLPRDPRSPTRSSRAAG